MLNSLLSDGYIIANVYGSVYYWTTCVFVCIICEVRFC